MFVASHCPDDENVGRMSERTVTFLQPRVGIAVQGAGLALLLWMLLSGGPLWFVCLIAAVLLLLCFQLLFRWTLKATLRNGDIEFRRFVGRSLVRVDEVVNITAKRHGDGNTSFNIESAGGKWTIEGTRGGRNFVESILTANPLIERRGAWPGPT
jgi:hypothetical protein